MSVDSPPVHKVWESTELSKITGEPVPFHMASDPGGKIGREFGVYVEDAGINTRGTFIIDPDGFILAADVMTPPVGRNIDEIIRQFQAYQLVRNTTLKCSNCIEVAPMNWRPGKKTLKPSSDLVGNVWREWTLKELD